MDLGVIAYSRFQLEYSKPCLAIGVGVRIIVDLMHGRVS